MFQTGTIASLKQDVLDALQGRTDVTDTVIARYVARTIRELTESTPFPELQSTGPNFQLTAGENTYAVSNFVNVGDVYSMPESFALFVDFPNNTIVSPVRFKTMAGIETMTGSAVEGVPAWFTRFGGDFIFGPNPTNPYTVYLRYQAKHPFAPTPTIDDPIYLPTSWYDIAAYSAAMRICVLKRWTDQRQELHDMLFGDPEFQLSQGKRGRPGLVSARVLQQERDQAYNSRSITPVISRSNPR